MTTLARRCHLLSITAVQSYWNRSIFDSCSQVCSVRFMDITKV